MPRRSEIACNRLPFHLTACQLRGRTHSKADFEKPVRTMLEFGEYGHGLQLVEDKLGWHGIKRAHFQRTLPGASPPRTETASVAAATPRFKASWGETFETRPSISPAANASPAPTVSTISTGGAVA